MEAFDRQRDHYYKMRKRGRTDTNQKEIVAAFRKLGATVNITSNVGDGFPDIVVDKFGQTVKVEIKDGNKSPSRQKLTEKEQRHHDECQGALAIISRVDQCAGLLDQMRIRSEYIKAGISRETRGNECID